MLKFDITDENDGSSPGSPDFENSPGKCWLSRFNNTYKVVVAACDVTADACDRWADRLP